MNKFLIMLCVLMSGCQSKQESLDISTKNLNIFLNQEYPTSTNSFCFGYKKFDIVNNCSAKLGDRLVRLYCDNSNISGFCLIEN
jgi:hypothetical protein